MRGFVSRAVIAVALLAGPLACGSTSGPPTINFYIFNEPSGSFTNAASSCTQAAGGRYSVAIQLLPNNADGQREQLVRRLAAGDSSIDIMGLDVTWAPEFAEAGWIRPVPDAVRSQVSQGTLASMLATGTWKGQLYGIPDNTNTQLLWYRKDLVPTPPKTWNQMLSMASTLAQQGKPHYVEIQGAQYEGLTVWFNSLVASAGGRILDDRGGLVVDASAAKAAGVMRSLATSNAADPSLSNQKEDDNRLAFESGKAAFELNYPFIYPSAVMNNPDLARNIGWTTYPTVDGGSPDSHVTIGGINLAVSTYSQHADLAFEAAACLRNADNEKYAAIKGGLPPTIESLYSDATLRQSYPFADTILAALKSASTRPLTPAYTNVSLEVQQALSPPSAIDTGGIVDALRGKVADAIDSKGLVP